MTIKINYNPDTKDAFKRGKYDIYAVVDYTMYDEMQPEFNKSDFKAKENILMNHDKLEISATETNYIYDLKLEYPYGDIKIELMYDTAGKPMEELDLKPLPDEENTEKSVKIDKDPEPISLAKLR